MHGDCLTHKTSPDATPTTKVMAGAQYHEPSSRPRSRSCPRRPVQVTQFSLDIHLPTFTEKLVSARPCGPEKLSFAIQTPANCGSTVVRYWPVVAVGKTLPTLCMTMFVALNCNSNRTLPTSTGFPCASRNSINKSLPLARKPPDSVNKLADKSSIRRV